MQTVTFGTGLFDPKTTKQTFLNQFHRFIEVNPTEKDILTLRIKAAKQKTQARRWGILAAGLMMPASVLPFTPNVPNNQWLSGLSGLTSIALASQGLRKHAGAETHMSMWQYIARHKPR